MPLRMAPLSCSYPDMTENFPEQAESSKRGEGNTEIMEMLRTIKKRHRREREEVGKTTTIQRGILRS